MNEPVLIISEFGEFKNQNVQLFAVSFPGRIEASVTNYGGILTSLKVPDKKGRLEDVVLGYDNLDSYIQETPYFGAIVGRYANRIAGGKFFLNGKVYKLAINNEPNSLHGGIQGFDKVIWKVLDTIVDKDNVKLIFEYTSPDREEGFPGTLKTIITYIFTETGFEIEYNATTDKPTVLNLTQHSYFNLSADLNNDILDHELLLKANHFLPVDENLIPTGKLEPVNSTPFDFTHSKTIGNDINAENKQLKFGNGFDHSWVFDTQRDVNEPVATLYHKQSGRLMEVITTEPALQFYTGNFLDNSIEGKGGVFYKKRCGLCLETQHFPDSPNQANFPSVVLNPGEVFKSRTTYHFSVR